MNWHLFFGHIGAWFTLLILNIIIRSRPGAKTNLVSMFVLCAVLALFSSMAHAWLFGRCG